jgi:hypothetical protein
VDPLFRDMLQVFELARILFDQVIPPDRKARSCVASIEWHRRRARGSRQRGCPG